MMFTMLINFLYATCTFSLVAVPIDFKIKGMLLNSFLPLPKEPNEPADLVSFGISTNTNYVIMNETI